MALWFGCCSASDDSEDERNRNEEDKETEIMEDLAMAQAMEPKTDVSGGFHMTGLAAFSTLCSYIYIY